MQSTSIAVTLDPAAYAKLAAEADKAGVSVAEHASRKLGADLDALAAQVDYSTQIPVPAKGRAKK